MSEKEDIEELQSKQYNGVTYRYILCGTLFLVTVFGGVIWAGMDKKVEENKLSIIKLEEKKAEKEDILELKVAVKELVATVNRLDKTITIHDAQTKRYIKSSQ